MDPRPAWRFSSHRSLASSNNESRASTRRSSASARAQASSPRSSDSANTTTCTACPITQDQRSTNRSRSSRGSGGRNALARPAPVMATNLRRFMGSAHFSENQKRLHVERDSEKRARCLEQPREPRIHVTHKPHRRERDEQRAERLRDEEAAPALGGARAERDPNASEDEDHRHAQQRSEERRVGKE